MKRFVMRTQNHLGRQTDPSDAMRLETPRSLGIRSGMSSSGVIGRKLGFVYGVDAQVPTEMNEALLELHRKLKLGA